MFIYCQGAKVKYISKMLAFQVRKIVLKHTGHSRQIFHFPVRRLQTPDENATAAALALGRAEEDRGGPARRSRSGGRGQGDGGRRQECQDLSGDHLAINWSTGELIKLEEKREDTLHPPSPVSIWEEAYSGPACGFERRGTTDIYNVRILYAAVTCLVSSIFVRAIFEGEIIRDGSARQDEEKDSHYIRGG